MSLYRWIAFHCNIIITKQFAHFRRMWFDLRDDCFIVWREHFKHLTVFSFCALNVYGFIFLSSSELVKALFLCLQQ